MSDVYELDDVEVKQTAGLMKQVNAHIKKLRELQWAMLEAEETYKQAEKAFLDYSRGTMPELFRMNGLDTIQSDDGTMVRVVTQTKCSINKNDADRNSVAEWLREHGASELVKSECIVPPSQIDLLKQNNIIYQEETTMNTNSVKAFVLDQLGQKGNPAMISREDLPKGLNFFQWEEMEIIHK